MTRTMQHGITPHVGTVLFGLGNKATWLGLGKHCGLCLNKYPNLWNLHFLHAYVTHVIIMYNNDNNLTVLVSQINSWKTFSFTCVMSSSTLDIYIAAISQNHSPNNQGAAFHQSNPYLLLTVVDFSLVSGTASRLDWKLEAPGWWWCCLLCHYMNFGMARKDCHNISQTHFFTFC